MRMTASMREVENPPAQAELPWKEPGLLPHGKQPIPATERLILSVADLSQRGGARFEGRVHEQVFYRLKELGIESVQTDIMIRHTGYRDEGTIRQKSERNLKIIQNELEGDPQNLVLHYNAARTLGGIGRLAEAIEHMEKILGNERIQEKEKQFFLEASILTGKYYADSGRYDRAATIFKDLARQFPENGLVHFRRAKTCIS
jgi:tetratricopeptide (TPR) repeat protein